VIGLAIDPPHRLEGGTVAVPTKVLGTEVVGAFFFDWA
jgi:hypothetical protein